MQRLITLLLLLAAPLAWGAAGDIQGIDIETNGWVADVYVKELNTNGTYVFGFGTNNSITGSERLKLTLTSQGFNDTGTAIAVQRVLYGTRQLRLPYPNEAINDERTNAGAMMLRIALSDYVYAGDSNITATVAGGLYTENSIASVSAAGLAVTNSSMAVHQKCVANWAWPGWQHVTGSTMILRAVGYHRSGQQGRPVRALRFVATGDTSGVAVTNWQTEMRYDPAVSDAVPVCEYIASISTTGFTSGEHVRCDFTAYPWVGDAGAVLDTFDNVNTTGPNYASITNWVDRSVLTVAVVSYTNSTADGVVVTNFNAASPPVAFPTLSAAANAITKTNLAWFNRNNAGGAVIYVRSGDYNFSGGTVASMTETNRAWLRVARFPGDAEVTITNASGTAKLSSWYWLDDIFIYWAGGGSKVYFNGGYVWTDRCRVAHNGSASYYQTTGKFFTRTWLTNWNSGVTRQYSTVNAPTILIRGCGIGSGLETAVPFTWLGNRSLSSASSFVWSRTTTGTVPSTGLIMAYNIGSVNAVMTQEDPQAQFGAAYVQNVFEKTNGVAHTLQIGADGGTSGIITNVLFINNSEPGYGMNWAYNDFNAVNTVRKYWLLQGNIFNQLSIVADKDVHGGGAGAPRTNNWSEYYGVGYSGNLICNYPFIGEWSGINAGVYGMSFRAHNPHWVNDASWAGSKLGLGDYHLQTKSLAVTLPAATWYLPYDIEGNARGASDPPGAYSSANPRKAAGFF